MTSAAPVVQHILLPYDFSPQAVHVVPSVVSLARALMARVTVLTVVPPAYEPLPAGLPQTLRASDDPSEWRSAAQRLLEGSLGTQFQDIEITSAGEVGDPAIRIVGAAHSQHVDLIMMPTRGVDLLHAVVLGSVTAAVMQTSACPVWTAAHVDGDPRGRAPRTIVCAVDTTTNSRAVAEYAIAFARQLGATLHLLHVVEPITDFPESSHEQRLQQTSQQRALAAVAALASPAAAVASVRAVVGDVSTVVSEESQRHRADLVIIGRGAVREAFGRFRTHGFRIVDRCACPVLSV